MYWKRCKRTYQQAAENESKAKSGSKVELINRVLTPARGNLSARDAIEDEEFPNSCEDNTSSESIDVILMTLMTLQMTLHWNDFDVRQSVIWSDVWPEEKLIKTSTSEVGMEKSMGGDFFQGGEGGLC